MKRNFLYSCLIALASLGFVACDSDNDEQEAKVPRAPSLHKSSHSATARTKHTLKTP